MRSVRLVAVAALVLGLNACATILGGSNQTITVNSNIAGAEVFLNDQLLGKTPLITSIKRGQEGVFKVRADGYQTYQMAVNKKINNLFWVNVFTGGTFGSSTDYSTGAMYLEYDASDLHGQPSARSLVAVNSETIGSEKRDYAVLCCSTATRSHPISRPAQESISTFWSMFSV